MRFIFLCCLVGLLSIVSGRTPIEADDGTSEISVTSGESDDLSHTPDECMMPNPDDTDIAATLFFNLFRHRNNQFRENLRYAHNRQSISF
jgi:hypothetical protein